MLRRSYNIFALAILSLLGFAFPASAQVYDASKNFSSISNPNGVWSYGFTNTLGSSLILDTAHGSDPRGFDFWLGNRASDGNPSVSHNRTNANVVNGTVTYLPMQIIQHPGPNGEYSTLRWTAPTTGAFALDIGFIGQDSTSTDVHILKNGVSLFSDTINGYGNSKAFMSSLALSANDVIDIKVGYGGNGFSNDSTGVRAIITAVPAFVTTISGGPVEGTTVCGNSVTFTFTGTSITTPTANLKYQYRLDNGAYSTPSVSTTATFNGLADGPHTFQVASVDQFGAVDPNPATRHFIVNGTAVTVSNIRAGSITPSSAIIKWDSSQVATSQVNYGATTAYGQTTTLDSAYVTQHSVTLLGLAENTTYHFRVRSMDGCLREAVSNDFMFTTTTAPDLQVSAVSAPPSVYTDRAFDVTWTDLNAGHGAAVGPWTDRILLSTDNQLGNDTIIADFPFSQSLSPNGVIQRIQTINIPYAAVPADGEYFLIVYTDVANNVNEYSNEGNNTRIIPIHVNRTPSPDLIVNTVQAPNTAFFDQTVTVSWTVKNIGNGSTDASEWYDNVQFRAPDGTVTTLATGANVSYLAAGDSYVAQANVHLPIGIFGTCALIVNTDTSNNVREGVETNNGKERPITLQVPPLPDLQVPQIATTTLPTVYAGSAIPVNWTAQNKGNGTTPPGQTDWTDGVYLSSTPDFSGSPQLLATFAHSGKLDVNASYVASLPTITLPRNLDGDYYVFVKTDINNNVYEYAFENNNLSAGKKIHVQSTPPDLIVATITAPASAIAERTLNISWVTKNQGAYEANGGWFDSVYLSNSATFDASKATLLATTYQSGPLAAGQTYTGSASVFIPACLSGSYYLYVFTDSRNNVYEFDPLRDAEANNVTQKAIALTSQQADLMASPTVIPATANAGQTIPITWTVSNIGLGDTQQSSWTDTVYLSATPNLSGASVLGSFGHTGALPKGQSYTQSLNVTVPITAQGAYYVIVYTDSGSVVPECDGEMNNLGISATQVNVINNPTVTNLPDLQIASISETGPFVSTGAITVNWTTVNKGVVPVTGSWLDSVYINTSPTLDGATLLKSVLHNGPLAPNATYNASAVVQLPNLSPGTYYLMVYTDSSKVIVEGLLENNNIGILGGGVGGTGGSGDGGAGGGGGGTGGGGSGGGNPGSGTGANPPNVDLQVTAVDQPDTAYSGQDVPVSWTVKNFGPDATLTPTWTDYIILSRDQVLDPTDRIIGYQGHSGKLVGGASYSAMQTVTLPLGLTGPYYVFVYTDWNNNIAETNEFNNATFDTKALFINLPPQTDLTVVSANPPATASPGENATFQWTVKNVGGNTAIGRWTDALYLSKDPTWNIGDTLIGRVDHSGPLAAGSSYTGTLTAELPAVTPGNYYLIVRTDVKNHVPESDETNNVGASVNPFPVDVIQLTLGVPFASTLPQDKERYFKVNTPANETLLWTLDSQAPDSANELYVRYGDVASRGAYDFQFSNPFASDQQITVPNTQAGNYYALARGNSVPTPPAPFTIKAELIPFSITGVSPSHIGDNGQVTITLSGAKFQDGATVNLVQGGQTLTAAKVWLVDNATAKARFFFTNAPHGVYDVVLTNPNGISTTAAHTITVETATALSVNVYATGDLYPRVGRSLSVYATLKNTGNVDVPYVDVINEFTGQVQIALHRPAYTLPRQADFTNFDWENASPTNQVANGSTTEHFTVRDFEPGQQLTFTATTKSYAEGDFTYNIVASPYTKAAYISQLQSSSEMARQALLQTPNNNLPDALLVPLQDSNKWWQYLEQQYISSGYLDNASANFSKPMSFANNAQCLHDQASCVGYVTGGYLICIVGAFLPPSIYSFAKVFLCTVGYNQALAYCLEKNHCDPSPPQGCQKGQWGSGGRSVKGCGQAKRPSDPNEKVGPGGYGPQAFVTVNQPLPYTIDFENMMTAGAAAQKIVITDQLDPTIDPRTLRLKEIGFGSYRITVPENRSYYQTRMQLGADLGNIYADISAGVDIATGIVTWTLSAVDPLTGEAPNSALLGLLLPNDATHRGEGYVTYTAQARDGVATGTPLANNATITFDAEQPIVTNTVTNTIDGLAPTSAVAALPALGQETFNVTWSGTDDAGGSGLANYDIYVSENGGPFQPWQTAVTTTSAMYGGVPGHTYRFYSIARDNAGNVETKTAADTGTAIPGVSGVITLDGIGNIGAVVVPIGPLTFQFRPLDGSAVINAQVSLDGSGAFSMGGIAAKKYNVWIKGAKWLAKVVPLDLTSGSAFGLNALLLTGDANNDNAIDATDFGIFVSAYNTYLGVPGSGYDPAADFDNDGSVDVTDFGLLVGNYNIMGDP